MRRLPRLLCIVILSAAVILSTLSGAWCRPEYRGITILHTNDIHDHLIPFSYPDPQYRKAPEAHMLAIKDIGGLARLATLARRIEAETRGNALLVDAGDILDGTPFGIEYKGEADYAVMSAAGYDVQVTGNHDFGPALPQFNRNLSLATFPVLCANLVRKGTEEHPLPEYAVYEIDGVKIAVLGLTTEEIMDYKAVKEGGFQVLDPYVVAAKMVPELREKADIVIVLSHLGSAEDEKLAKRAPGIDVIVGGHSHARLANPKIIRHDGASGAFTLGGTVIVQAYQWAGELGRLDLRLRRNEGPFTLMSVSGKLLPVTPDLPDDPETAQVVRRYYKPLSKKYGKVIGEATADLVDAAGAAGPVMNLICDAIREETGTQISVYGIGGVRGDITKGPITGWDIATILPFSNKLVVMNLTGARIKEALTRFPVKPGVSGMKYKTVGREVVEATIDGKPLDDDTTYTVGTIDWLVGLYFTDVKDVKTLDKESTPAVMEYIKRRKTISPVVDDRRDVR